MKSLAAQALVRANHGAPDANEPHSKAISRLPISRPTPLPIVHAFIMAFMNHDCVALDAHGTLVNSCTLTPLDCAGAGAEGSSGRPGVSGRGGSGDRAGDAAGNTPLPEML